MDRPYSCTLGYTAEWPQRWLRFGSPLYATSGFAFELTFGFQSEGEQLNANDRKTLQRAYNAGIAQHSFIEGSDSSAFPDYNGPWALSM